MGIIFQINRTDGKKCKMNTNHNQGTFYLPFPSAGLLIHARSITQEPFGKLTNRVREF